MVEDLLSIDPPASMTLGLVVLHELAALGVSDVVCCPGSRSAPLAYAAASMESEGRIRLHMRTDERSAGFFALGIAKATLRAVAVITTSGTAVANLAPAMAEARFARIPLLALCADRPSTLVGTGANQTADQVGIFGTLVLNTLRLSSDEGSPDAWRACIRRGVVAAEGRLSRCPGPIHVNIELNEPLVGDPGPVVEGGPFTVAPVSSPHPTPITAGPRTVIVAGDMPVEEGRWWARKAHEAQIPLLAEPSSNARSLSAAIAGYRYLLPGFLPHIERVIVAGHPTLSRQVMGLLGGKDKEIIAVNDSGSWPDPGWAVSSVLARVSLSMGDPEWMNQWLVADRRFRARINESSGFNGQVLASLVIDSLQDDDVLVVGASNPIRDVDLAPISGCSPRIYSQRGLAGIDGTIAAACGISVGLGTGVVALMGDLTALHDLTSVIIPTLETTPDVRLIIADDRGGSIFSTMEYGASRAHLGALADHFERLFSVPTSINLSAIFQGLGIEVTTVSTPTEVTSAVTRPIHGIDVLHVPLDRTSRADYERMLQTWGRASIPVEQS
ncbi:MAG: 2-succinyl-5-enolpyruvyl-6-hydroxy-3-cyclohexene-1-carboxylic-acid synthase [Propionibacteriaceae bacterium]|nr:2-succinyl-5-enolpyruvyl-6-hydroxy-3-cyclohexene-1-carboxylic-acid synthase [Propionibacteriaceae bacterium]